MMFGIWMGRLGHLSHCQQQACTHTDFTGEFASKYTNSNVQPDNLSDCILPNDTLKQTHINWGLCFGHLFIISLSRTLSSLSLTILLHPCGCCASSARRCILLNTYVKSYLLSCMMVCVHYKPYLLCACTCRIIPVYVRIEKHDVGWPCLASCHSLIYWENTITDMNFNQLWRIWESCFLIFIGYADWRMPLIICCQRYMLKTLHCHWTIIPAPAWTLSQVPFRKQT